MSNTAPSNFDKVGKAFLKYLFKERSYLKKVFPILCIVILFDLLENVVSGGTSFGFISSKANFFLPGVWASVGAIIFLGLFEGAKLLLYVNFFIDIFSGRFSFSKLIFVVALTAGSVWFTINGTTPLVHTYAKDPIFVPQSELAAVYKTQIEGLDAQIANLIATNDKSYTLVTTREINKLRSKKEPLLVKLEEAENSRTTKNENVLVEQSETVTLTANSIIWFALILNFISILMLAPFQAHVFKKSYDEFFGDDGATEQKKAEQISQSVPASGTEQKSIPKSVLDEKIEQVKQESLMRPENPKLKDYLASKDTVPLNGSTEKKNTLNN